MKSPQHPCCPISGILGRSSKPCTRAAKAAGAQRATLEAGVSWGCEATSSCHSCTQLLPKAMDGHPEPPALPR